MRSNQTRTDTRRVDASMTVGRRTASRMTFRATADARASGISVWGDGRVWINIFLVALLCSPGLLFSTPRDSLAQGASAADDAASATAGVAWRNLTLDEALAEAAETGSLIMIDFWAGHCHSCGDMDQQVWRTSEGGALTDGLIPIQIDSTSPEGRTASSRYPITALPTVLFLNPDGSELDRIEGYDGPGDFLVRAEVLSSGADPLPGLEARLEQQPKSAPAVFEVMDRYLNRGREEEADSLFARLLELDPQNGTTLPEQAIRKLAKHHEYFRGDNKRAAGYWETMVERFPYASSSAAAADRVYKIWSELGRRDEWVPWICGVLEANRNAASLHRNVARSAVRNGVRGDCLAEAARRAGQLRASDAALMDSLATILSGGR